MGNERKADDNRPDPDKLLARVKTQEMLMKRGKLKIFFGAAAGVGKTYNMLDVAHQRQSEGIDVVIGYIEPHARPETVALIEGFEAIPPRSIDYKGTTLKEFDLDAALIRRPTLILVDELAHTNAPGSRHPKRWHDVEELLAAGINVYTTLNVQHIESLSDVVAQITGTVVRETVPDSIVEQADEVELIDISPEDLLQRLKEGKVYIPQQAERAMQSFFRKGNLMALRELALRRTADRVDDQMQDYRRDHAVRGTWPATERILVCISPSPLSARLVRAAKRMATGLHADWVAVYVETPAYGKMLEADRNQVVQTLRLAEQLGGDTITLNGHQVTEEILNYAHERNVNRIIVGKPVHPRWRDVLFGSMLDDLVRNSGQIDVYVISGDPDDSKPLPTSKFFQPSSTWPVYLRAVLIFILFTLICAAMLPFFEPVNLIMVYLVGVVIVAARYGRGPSVLASILSVLAFDFFFIHPYLTFAVSDTEYIITFIIMLLVALTISSMTVRIKYQAEMARERERRTTSLYTMSRGFASSQSTDDLVHVASENIGSVFKTQVAVLLPDSNGNLIVQHGLDTLITSENELTVAQWVCDHGQSAGIGMTTLPGAKGLYLPLVTPRGTAGVVAVYPSDPQQFGSPDQLHLLETFVNQTALAIERALLSEETERAQLQIATERMRSSLLSSVSHDLRTPLTTITGAVSSLLNDENSAQSLNRHELLQIAYEEAERLNRLVGNLLDMTKLESGSIEVDKEWQPLEEVVGSALNRLDSQIQARTISVKIPDDFPLLPFDSVLIEQVLVNLVENAVKYTPENSPIEFSAELGINEAIVEVADRGLGIEVGKEQLIFNKFYRINPTKASGVGLGLAICKAIVEAHGGRIWVANRAGGGAAFRFTLPFNGTPPEVKIDE